MQLMMRQFIALKLKNTHKDGMSTVYWVLYRDVHVRHCGLLDVMRHSMTFVRVMRVASIVHRQCIMIRVATVALSLHT